MTLLARDLLGWFATTQRTLPWRAARTPYRVWVSEVMLQQTQVATATPYFERWMQRFPDIRTLAAAPLSEVLKAWEGLGYYRRARLLHEGAKRVVQDYGGALPERYSDLLKLPGLGPYTAAAIASLAFGERVLAVDGNVKRVTARLFCLPGEIKTRAVEACLEPHLPKTGAGTFNEALMELGAMICRPRAPRCEACPVKTYCAAFQTRQVARFPEAKARRKAPHVYRFALICQEGTALWLRKRSENELLGGLWGFVLCAEEPDGERLEPVTHAYTHFKITVTPVLVATPPENGQWLKLEELGTLPLSRLDHKLLARWRQAKLAS